MAELLHAGIDPLNAIKSGIEILEEKQREKYLDVIAGKKINEQDYLSNSITLILNSSITGSKISETLRLNLETYQRSHRNEVLKAIKKSEVYLLGPLRTLLPTHLHVDRSSSLNWIFDYWVYVMSYPHALVIQRNFNVQDTDLEFVAFCKSKYSSNR